MQENFNVFYCTVCHICKSSPTCEEASKFCSGCKLIQYCCTSHQREDWPDHKQFCKAIQHILKRTATDHVFNEVCSYTRGDFVGWSKLRMSVVQLTELILKRSLTSVESQILLFPPLCNFCNQYKGNEMFSCKLCNTVMYCSVDHQKSDQKHASVCDCLSLSFKIDMLRFFKLNKTVNMLNLIKNFKPSDEFPENMSSFLKCINTSVVVEDLLLSESLSYALTLVFAIYTVTKNMKSRITLHIVGGDGMEVMAVQTFPIIFQFLSHLTHLNIVMIGPNLSSTVTLPYEINGKCSLHCISSMLYHEYAISANSCPDVIAVFNSGFCEFSEVPEKDIWKNSLPFILGFRDCTVILTSYTTKEGTADFERLIEMKRHNTSYDVFLKSKLNPYSSLYPHRDWESEHGGVFYVNKYISVLKT